MLFSIIVVVTIIIIFTLKVYATLTLGRCKSPVCLIGKTVLITGGNSGIGFQTALALAGRGCRLIIADKDDCEKSKEKIIQETGNTNIVIKQFDLSSLNSVRKFAKDINANEDRLDILINNAGVIGVGHRYTEDGLHMAMQVNHFGPFLLTHLLVGLLKRSAPSRIIFTSSIAAYTVSKLTLSNLNFPKSETTNMFRELHVYGNSKLCSVITAKIFGEKLKGTGVTSNSLHPGIVVTPMFHQFPYDTGHNKLINQLTSFALHYPLGFFWKDIEEGAQTTIHLALAKEVQEVTGTFFADCKPFSFGFMTPSSAQDQTFFSKIWKASEDYVKLTPTEKL